MPRYHYECTKCGHAYDLIEGWDAKSQRRCPECRSKAIRIPKAPVIIFKGKGFYSSDNRSSSFESKRREEETGTSGDGTADDGTSGDGTSGDGKSAGGESGDKRETKPAAESKPSSSGDRSAASKSANKPKAATRKS